MYKARAMNLSNFLRSIINIALKCEIHLSLCLLSDYE